MSKFYKLIMLAISVQIFCTPHAYAISKLSSFARKVPPYTASAKDYLSAAQEIVNGVQTDVNRIKSLAENGELGDALKKEALDHGKKFAKSEYDKYKEKRKKEKELKKKEKEREAAVAAKDDYKEAVKDEQMQKNKKIDERLAELNSMLQVQSSEDERKKIIDEISSLEAQKQSNTDKQLESDATYKSLQENENKATKEVADLKKETAEADTEDGLYEQTKGLFDITKEAAEENKAIYQAEIDALFLKEEEESTSENMARIKKNRGREYYNAIQKALNVSVVGASSSAKINEDLKKYVEMGSKVDSNLSVKNINIGVTIVNAKAAASLTEVLLADMRLKTMKDMQGWNNKNKLYDYSKPVTEFDIDSYELKKSNLKDKAKSFIDNNKDKAKDYFNNHKDDLKNMWHKI